MPDASQDNGGSENSAGLNCFDKALFEEACALMSHMCTDGTLAKDDENQQVFGKLVDAVHKMEAGRDAWPELVKAYQGATAITLEAKNIDGRSILDTKAMKTGSGLKASSETIYHKKGYRATRWALLFILAALMLDILASWVGSVQEPDKHGFYIVIQPLVGPLIGFVWGAIGSCLYLMKHLSDHVKNFSYREAKLSGDGTRIVIGAILGMVVVWLFFPEFDEQIAVGDVEFGAATAALLSGLGVKAVYGALEQLIEILAGWLGGKRS